MRRLAFPGNCKDKTGPDAKKFSSEYKDFLGKSFETQTWVYEQAVSASILSMTKTKLGWTDGPVRLDHVDLED